MKQYPCRKDWFLHSIYWKYYPFWIFTFIIHTRMNKSTVVPPCACPSGKETTDGRNKWFPGSWFSYLSFFTILILYESIHENFIQEHHCICRFLMSLHRKINSISKNKMDSAWEYAKFCFKKILDYFVLSLKMITYDVWIEHVFGNQILHMHCVFISFPDFAFDFIITLKKLWFFSYII